MCNPEYCTFFFFSFIFIIWRLITSQHFNGFCHTLTWISHGVTCIPHPNPPSHLPLHPIPLGLPSAPGPSTCLMHLLNILLKLIYIKGNLILWCLPKDLKTDAHEKKKKNHKTFTQIFSSFIHNCPNLEETL